MTGQELKAFIKARGWSNRELGERIGYSESAISKAITTDAVSGPLARAVQMWEEIEVLRAKSGKEAACLQEQEEAAKALEHFAQMVAKAIKNA